MTFANSPADLPSLEQMRTMSGLDFMQKVLSGDLPAPPIAQVLNYQLTSVEDGKVVFTGSPRFAHCNPMGGVHGGWYGTLLDSCMACAVMTKVPAGCSYTTLEYKINITRALPLDTEIHAIGQISHSGRSTGVASGEIRGVADNRLYATGSTTCLIIALPVA